MPHGGGVAQAHNQQNGHTRSLIIPVNSCSVVVSERHSSPLQNKSTAAAVRICDRDKATSIRRYLENEFAEVLSSEQFQESVGKGFESFDNMLARFELARRHPACHFLNSVGIAVGVVKDQHAFHGRATNEQR